MNAASLSGGIRAGSIVRRAAPRPTTPSPVAAEPSPSALRVEARGGVWCVGRPCGAVVAPCATEKIARESAAAFGRMASFAT